MSVEPKPDEQRPAVAVHRLVRHVLSRRKGWRMPENTIKVCRPSKYGNPFHVADVLEHYDGDVLAAQADCVRSYRRWIEEGSNYSSDDAPPSIEEIRSDLAGKNLACWCKAGTPCHADVLLDLANEHFRPDFFFLSLPPPQESHRAIHIGILRRIGMASAASMKQ